MDADSMTLPMAVTSVDKDLMVQQQALTLRDAVSNVITKTPQPAPITEAMGTVGSRGYYELGVDLGRPLNDSKSSFRRYTTVATRW